MDLSSQESDRRMDVDANDGGPMEEDIPSSLDTTMGGPSSPRPSEIAPAMSPPIPGTTGLALVAPLTDERLASYEVPDDTWKCGTNCMTCCLRLLGWISRTTANFETERCIRAVAGEVPYTTNTDVAAAVQEWHPNYYGHPIRISVFGLPVQGVYPGVLNSVFSELPNGYGCFFMYGSGEKTHAVVLRKRPDGTPELIDPQRGLRVYSQYTPFQEVGAPQIITLTTNYYSTTGEENILRTIVEQATLFGYFPTREAATAGMKYITFTYTLL